MDNSNLNSFIGCEVIYGTPEMNISGIITDVSGDGPTTIFCIDPDEGASLISVPSFMCVVKTI